MKKTILIIALGAIIGCGQQPAASLSLADQPLSVEEWKSLEVAEKYAPETLDRLKASDPKLSDERHWDKFMIGVVVPERKKDIPTEY